MASLKVLLLISVISSSQSVLEKHSLYYTYSAVSKPLNSGEMCEFYNSVELDDIQMSLCNRVNKAYFITQLCEESERLFNESDDLHYKQQWIQTSIKALMEHKRNENSTLDTDLHVLQWRHGCAVERHSNGSVMFLQGSDEYAYDGEIVTFDLSMHWKPLVLDDDIIWDRESVSSLERKCVETLTRFTDLQREGKFIMKSRPDVHTLVKALGSSDTSLLVCLATGFYPKHVQMEIRLNQTPVPEDQLNSEGIRPNADGSFQLKKSLEILSSERSSQYQCVVTHQTLPEPLFIRWDAVSVLLPVLAGFIVALVVLAIILLVFYLLRKCVKRRSFIQKHPKVRLQLLESPKWPESLELESSDEHLYGCSGSGSRIASVQLKRKRGRGMLTTIPRPRNNTSLRIWDMEPELLEERRPEICAAALHTDSDEENPTDPSIEEVHTEEVHTEEVHDTQSLCETEATPAARGAMMGSKNISLPDFAMEREDADQNTVTQNALLLPPPRRCRSKNISLPNLSQDRKDSDDSG